MLPRQTASASTTTACFNNVPLGLGAPRLTASDWAGPQAGQHRRQDAPWLRWRAPRPVAPGGTACTLSVVTFLRSFRWGHEASGLEGRRWTAAQAYSPSTWIRRSARYEDWPRRVPDQTGAGYHPAVPSLARRRADVGSQHRPSRFLREVGGFATEGPAGLTMRAGAASMGGRRLPPDGCPLLHLRQHKSLHNLIEATRRCLDADSLLDGRCPAVAETTYTPFQSEPDAAPVRLIIAGAAHARLPTGLFATYSYRLGTEPWNWRLTIAVVAPQVGLNHLPVRFAGVWRYTTISVWVSRFRDHQDPPAAVLRPGRTHHPLGTPPGIFPSAGPGKRSVGLRAIPLALPSNFRSARVPCCVFSRHAHPSLAAAIGGPVRRR